MSVLKNASVMSLAVFISRFLGLVREQVFAYFFGASLWADAYLVAFRIPNLFRDLFAEGALSSAFVSVFSKQSTHKESEDLYNKMMVLLWIVVGLLSIFIFFTSQYWVGFLAPSFKNDPEKWSVTLDLVRMFSPFILFVSAASLVMGVLNSKGVFFIPSMGAASFNVGNILLGGALAFYFGKQSDLRGAILGFGVGTLLGGFLQWSVQWRSLAQKGYSPFSFFKMLANPKNVFSSLRDSRVKKIFTIMSPSVLTVAAVQINVMVNTLFATSIGTGAVSHLSYAFRILHFPMGLFGVALSTASLPVLSKLVKENKSADFKVSLENSIKWSLILAMGSTAGMLAFSEVLVSLFYEHGKFTREDTINTALVLATYSIGLIAFNTVKVVTSAFYALESVWVPSIVSILAIVSNYLLNSYFVKIYGTEGLALTTSLLAIFNSLVLMLFLKFKFNIDLFTKSLGKTFMGTFLISVLLVWLCKYQLNLEVLLLEIRDATTTLTFVPKSFQNRWGLTILSLSIFALFGILYLATLGAFDKEARTLAKKIKSRLFSR